MSNLNAKQKRFCEEYVIDLNVYQAMIRAGYSHNFANAQGYKMLGNVGIEAYVKELQNNISKATGVTAIRNVLELKKIAYSSISNINKEWKELRRFNELTDDEKAAISEININTAGEVSIKMHSKRQAIETLNRMLGFNSPDKKEVSGSIDIPIAKWIEGFRDEK